MTPSDNGLRHRYLEVLMDQVRDCRFPSPSMMDRIEAAVGDRESAEEYVGALLELISAERYPSPPMLDRISGLIEVLDRRGAGV